VSIMYKGKKIAVVVPAYNEERLISDVVNGLPDFVDLKIVVDDCSEDSTATVIENLAIEKANLILIRHDVNKGVGAAIKSGYTAGLKQDLDIVVVMAGDNQMDPKHLPRLLDAIVDDGADYSKGNRLFSGKIKNMPLIRRFGNTILTLLNKIASGYWQVHDPQNGYTAITKESLKKINFGNIYDRYGCPNDFLIEANIRSLKVRDVEMEPVYAGETSGIKIITYSFVTSFLLLRGFFRRINTKYGGLRFHPIWLFYYLGFILSSLLLIFSARLVLIWNQTGIIPQINAIAVGILFIGSTQFLTFALWLDNENSSI